MHAQRKGHGRTEGEGGQGQLEEAKPADVLILDFQFPET